MLIACLVGEQAQAGDFGDVPGPIAFLESEKDLGDDPQWQTPEVNLTGVVAGRCGPQPVFQVEVRVLPPQDLGPLGMWIAESQALRRVAAPVAEFDPAEARVGIAGQVGAGEELFEAQVAALEVPEVGGADLRRAGLGGPLAVDDSADDLVPYPDAAPVCRLKFLLAQSAGPPLVGAGVTPLPTMADHGVAAVDAADRVADERVFAGRAPEQLLLDPADPCQEVEVQLSSKTFDDLILFRRDVGRPDRLDGHGHE
ncbi:hypothetical protein ACFP51_24400 [Streptomyces pratens]|uniref:Secreted protein n=1 Tax=Streptomyces pratens TaxID=887456 RepID=A0ABW1LZR7_9ACTN